MSGVSEDDAEEVTSLRAGATAGNELNRNAIGSLAGWVDLSGDWDSPETNAEIAADFGLE